MIGKMMSEAAHSIIGMFSARPVGMDNNASNTDFGSLLQPAEQQPQSTANAVAVDALVFETDDADDFDSEAVQNWAAHLMLPVVDHNGPALPSPKGAFLGTPEAPVASDEAAMLVPADTFGGRKPVAGQAVAAEATDPAFQVPVTPMGRPGQERAPLSTGTEKSEKSLAGGEAEAASIAPRLETVDPRQPLIQKLGSEAPNAAAASAQSTSPLLAATELVRPIDLPNSPLMAKGFKRTAAQDEAGTAEVLPTKPAEVLANQLPIANLSAIPAVRETVQANAPFDLSAPRLAERLAAEISDMSVSGESKKFEINPRNLGRMEIMFTTRGSTEIIEIQTDHRSAKDIIVQHSHILQDLLKSQGRDDLTLRVDVKDHMATSTKGESGHFSQQHNRDERQQQSAPVRPVRTRSAFSGNPDSQPVSDTSRYA